MQFALGVDIFLASHTDLVRGQRVGLITNQTGKNATGTATIDLLYRHPAVNLVALFAPEHGIRGVKAAGEVIHESQDTKTGLPIYSLYGGDDHRPPKVALDTIDTLVYDIQDVGSRAYTYIWSLAEAMAAAGENGKTVIVLDRPNPLTCQQIDGPITAPKWRSFLGLYPIPRVYGTTVGEIARYFNGEHNLRCRLIVMPMAGYARDTSWAETGLTWVGPSPNIPTVESAICFPATGTIGTLGTVHIGIGTRTPFQLVGAPWLNADHAATKLMALNLPGVAFQPITFTPERGLFNGDVVNGVFLRVHTPSLFRPSTTELALLTYLQRYHAMHLAWPTDKQRTFDTAMGTDRVRRDIQSGRPMTNTIAEWHAPHRQFLQRLQQYLIYR